MDRTVKIEQTKRETVPKQTRCMPRHPYGVRTVRPGQMKNSGRQASKQARLPSVLIDMNSTACSAGPKTEEKGKEGTKKFDVLSGRSMEGWMRMGRKEGSKLVQLTHSLSVCHS
mmetsp:Transcript_39797/g.78453  ORF Transcript_39797/g.78453 Transcript_39797/m.78453 type:complete len:114 (-) Transcript_39797:65-406(-)